MRIWFRQYHKVIIIAAALLLVNNDSLSNMLYVF